MRLPSGKRIKWEPAALMVLVLALGLWLAFGPASGPRFPLRAGATTQDIRISRIRGVLEFVPGGAPPFRLFMQGGDAQGRPLTGDEVKAFYGPRVYEQAVNPGSNKVFRLLNITSWVGVVWLGIGALGQIAFSGRMVLQWITSERRKQSIITESFWWFSLCGSVMLFSYFVWRQDPIAILGQTSGIVIYARNLRLIYKHKRRTARQASLTPDIAGDAGPAPAR